MATSLMRPDMMAGPMLRKARPDRSSEVRRGAGAALAGGLAAGFAAAWAGAGAGVMTVNTRPIAITATSILFMETSSWAESDYGPSEGANSSRGFVDAVLISDF